MNDVVRTIEKIAPSQLSVIIVGEHGTGKEWAARMIHELSPRSRGPFWPFDCAAIAPEQVEKELFGALGLTRDGVSLTRGVFEETSGGTLLLNEIDVLPLAIQKKISRALEYQTIVRVGEEKTTPINVRIIGTLNRSFQDRSKDGVFGEEWFLRLSPMVIEIPPLRERREDIPVLIENMMGDLRTRHGSSVNSISSKAQELLIAYEWPGNVRSLKNAIEYALVMAKGPVIEAEDLPLYVFRDHAFRRQSPPL
jgi:DNA-binding NtrC family response regulator